ncbi:MAG TPA: site-2 protease family protein [Ktedonobacterales bacterium]|jgi:hypothetical protein
MPVRSWRWQISHLLNILIGTFFFKYTYDSLQTALHGARLGGGPLALPADRDLFIWVGVFMMLWLMHYLVTLVHEGGHFLVGALVGFEFHYMQIGPLKFIRGRDDLHIRWDGRQLAGGAVASYPLSSHLARLRLALMVAAGPLASVLLGLLAWRLLVGYLAPCHSDGPPYDAYLSTLTGNAEPLCLAEALAGASALSPLLILFFFVLMWDAALGGLINLLLPYSGQQGIGDGLRLLRLLMGGAAAERETITMQMAGLQVLAVRPRDWPAQLVLRRLALAETPPQKFAALVSAYAWALDNGSIARAGAYLDQAHMTSPVPISRTPLLALESAYFEARHHANAAAAREWLRQGMRARSKYEAILRPRAEAALALLEGNGEQVQVLANAALAAIGQALLDDPTLPEMWLQEEEEQLRQMLAEAGSPQPSEDVSPLPRPFSTQL